MQGVSKGRSPTGEGPRAGARALQAASCLPAGNVGAGGPRVRTAPPHPAPRSPRQVGKAGRATRWGPRGLARLQACARLARLCPRTRAVREQEAPPSLGRGASGATECLPGRRCWKLGSRRWTPSGCKWPGPRARGGPAACGVRRDRGGGSLSSAHSLFCRKKPPKSTRNQCRELAQWWGGVWERRCPLTFDF